MERARIERISAGTPDLYALIQELLEICIDGLPLMRRVDGDAFAFTRKRSGAGELALLGRSHRYGAIVLLGARGLPLEVERSIFGGMDGDAFCSRLIGRLGGVSNVGDVALTAWAAAERRHPDLAHAVNRLRDLGRESGALFTVEAAWRVSAFSAAAREIDTQLDARRARDALVSSFNPDAGLFAHHLDPARLPWYRAHQACFADQVYPIQALARFHGAFSDSSALTVAARCAEQICRVQGEGGQWWWHYDSRSGRVIEGYPVYSVHQDAMAPMALFDLFEAGGPDHADAIRRGLRWMRRAPEVGRSLIDKHLRLIWRKVGRRDPGKVVRGLRAAAVRLHPELRLGWLDTLFRPTSIDWESRPYHLGWVLYAWQREALTEASARSAL